ncbi:MULTISPECIES: polysaccharide deacetylase family protein [Paraburkholderia]|uniref:polysaccharide deacetylase family protein n=1 Tax=Paraburkholderia TaxID=1822464 RepID=UPI0022569307|nr:MULTISPECIES: polysaccharide deacetylase family protein [Paraburkholderia]MCX4157468.1 polysaccharide deacetylase family protein [Paraburkholderia aspalathi]MDN7166872.1 polysaccharide deacetylase family protein [Paraburkholderia sp. SECH2]MDQ6395358.1 polysaccharide deacetylase family protein [Paraburkholderia aspalathi]
MIGVLFPNDSAEAGRYVMAAVQRSVSAAQVLRISRSSIGMMADTIIAVDVSDALGEELARWLQDRPRKLIVFGSMPQALAGLLDYQVSDGPAALQTAARSEPAPSREWRESAAAVQYTPLAKTLGAQPWHRPFERFDFTDEWNNLGFGAIRADASIWSVAGVAQVPLETELAAVHIDGERSFSYAALWDVGSSSVLWFNRKVGPCDSFEWRVVENFLSAYRTSQLPCHPVLSEIPWGADAAITSRLDCDEDVQSARPLWQTYRHLGVPFTLAVHTQNLGNPEHFPILRELLADGGAVLSHTATHAPNWGGSYEAALQEGLTSAALIQDVIGQRPRYAVSPFHQTPPYALQALSDAGYDGCIGGIIRNDPEFVIGRGGALADLPAGFVGHSQQCMLHGDCVLAQGDPLAIFKQAFDLAFETNTLFGYLDHPFSSRYSYGWSDEPARIAVHEQFVAYMKSRAAKPLFMTEETAMDFLRYKSLTQVVMENGALRSWNLSNAAAPFPLCVELAGERMPLELGVAQR